MREFSEHARNQPAAFRRAFDEFRAGRVGPGPGARSRAPDSGRGSARARRNGADSDPYGAARPEPHARTARGLPGLRFGGPGRPGRVRRPGADGVGSASAARADSAGRGGGGQASRAISSRLSSGSSSPAAPCRTPRARVSACLRACVRASRVPAAACALVQTYT